MVLMFLFSLLSFLSKGWSFSGHGDADKSNQASMDTKTVSKKLHAYVIFIADLSELMKIIVSPLFVIFLFIYI